MDSTLIGRIVFGLFTGLSCGVLSVASGGLFAFLSMRISQHRVRPGPDGGAGGQVLFLAGSCIFGVNCAIGVGVGALAYTWNAFLIGASVSAALGGISLSVVMHLL